MSDMITTTEPEAGFEDSRFVYECDVDDPNEFECGYCGLTFDIANVSPQSEMCWGCYHQELADWEATQAEIDHLWRTR